MICSSGSSVTIRNTLPATLYTSSPGVKGWPWLTSGRARAAWRAVSWSRSPAALTGPAVWRGARPGPPPRRGRWAGAGGGGGAGRLGRGGGGGGEPVGVGDELLDEL